MSKSQVLNLRIRALTPAARERYNRLKAFAAAESAAHEGAIVRQTQLIEQRQRAAAKVRQLEAAGPLKKPAVDIGPDGTHTAGWRPDTETLEAAKADLESVKDELEALNDTLRGGRLSVDMGTVASWLVQRPSGTVWRDRPPAIELKDDESPEMRLEYLNADIAVLREQLDAASDAPLTVKEATAAFVADIQARAAAARPKLDGLFKIKPTDATGKRVRQGRVVWPTTYHGNGRTELDANLFFWACEKEIIAKGKAEIAALGSEDAMSLEERDARKADLKRALHDLAFDECFLIDLIERKTGKPHPRRRGVPVDALLGVEPDSEADFG